MLSLSACGSLEDYIDALHEFVPVIDYDLPEILEEDTYKGREEILALLKEDYPV